MLLSWPCLVCGSTITGPSRDCTETDPKESKTWLPGRPVMCVDCWQEAIENVFAKIVPGYDQTKLNDWPAEAEIIWPDWDIVFIPPLDAQGRVVTPEAGGKLGGKAWVRGRLVHNARPQIGNRKV